MTASMFQGEVQYMSQVGSKMKTRLSGPIAALKQGSVGPVKSDMQVMQDNERRQHEQTYIYEHGHNDGSAPLGTPSF